MLTLGFVLLLAGSPPSGPGLALDVDPCLELDEPLLRETVELRLGPGPDYHRGTGTGTDPGTTRVFLDCGPGADVELTVIDPISHATVIRTVELPPIDRRSEQLGVQTVALIRSVWLSVELDHERPRTRAQRVASRVARRPASAWELGDGFMVRSYLGSDSPPLQLGEQLEVVHRPLRHLAWKTDGELGFWRVPVEADGVSGKVSTLTISAAPVLLGWGEIPSGARRGAGTVAVYGGAGFRAGGVRMRSDSFANTDGFLPFGGPLAQARVSISLGRFVGLAVNVEAGWLLHGPQRPKGIPLSLAGPWTNAVLVIVSRF